MSGYLGLERRKRRDNRIKARAQLLTEKYGLNQREALKMAWELERLAKEEIARGKVA